VHIQCTFSARQTRTITVNPDDRTHGAATVAGGAYVLMGVAAAHTVVTFRPSRPDPVPSADLWRHADDRAIEVARHRMA